jgi:zinc/manganese transport system substrate-binding protein
MKIVSCNATPQSLRGAAGGGDEAISKPRLLRQHLVHCLAMTAVLSLFLGTNSLLAATDKIKIAATTTTLASIAGEITGGRAEVHAIASPYQNIHFYQPTPKDVVKVKRADVLVHGGLDLEMWREPLVVAAGNPKFIGEAPAAIDASKGVKLLEIPASLSRAEGDIHRFGNPHYWMDPENAKQMVKNIAEGLASIFPESAEEFRKNADSLTGRIDEKTREWERRLKPWRGTSVVTYHKNWVYFTERFGFEIAGELEPKPGIPPTPKHLTVLETLMKTKGVKLVIKESYQEGRTPKKIAEDTGAKVLTLAQAVGETKEGRDYISMMENNVLLIEEALR